MSGQGLRAQHLDSLRTKAYDYFMQVNRPVQSRELARVLFDPPRDPSSVTPFLIRALLGRDGRFREAPREIWQLSTSPYMDLPLEDASFAVVDLEATGSRPEEDRVIEVAVVRVKGFAIVETFSSLVNPLQPIPKWIRGLTGIDESMLQDAPRFHQLAPRVSGLLSESIFVAHNVEFDYNFLRAQLGAASIDPPPWPRLCTVELCRRRHPQLDGYSLGSLAEHFDIELRSHHRAIDDALATAAILIRELEALRREGLGSVRQLLPLGAGPR